jgi:paraquat-inducible protein B
VDENDADPLPSPAAPERGRFSLSKVWIIPVVAAAIALGLAFQRIAREGPTVTITFKSVGGVEAGKTQIRYKDVVVGLVTAVHLSPDFRTVEVSAKIAKEAEGLMTEGASFWIVRPRVTLSEVSGLGTLLSGNYIGFERGAPDRVKRQFTGLETARVIDPDAPGRRFTVHARDALHVDVGLPVYYQGIQAGQVTSFDLAPDGRTVDLEIFVSAPYDAHVYPSTRFWNASGLDVSVNGAGLDVRTESLTTLLVGGLAFDNPRSSESETPASQGASFKLYRDRATALKEPDPNERRYVLYFNESLDGIERGTPVRFLGIHAGEVVQVGVDYDRRVRRMRGRLEITFSPERLIERLPTAQIEGAQALDRSPERRTAFLRDMVMRQGLRARLHTASLVTGQRYVAFEYVEHARAAQVDWGKEPLELPVVPGVLPAFEEKLAALLDKFDALPLQEIAGDVRALIGDARTTLRGLDVLTADIDTKAVPKFATAMDEARAALNAAERMLDGASATLVGPDAPGQRELRSALQEVTHAARALRTLSDSIERHPESLVRGRSGESPIP